VSTKVGRPITFYMREALEADWVKLEKAGQIALNASNRERLQTAFESYQSAKEMDAGSVRPADVRSVLKKVAAALQGAVSELAHLRDHSTSAAEAAFSAIQQRSIITGDICLDRAEVEDLQRRLVVIQGYTNAAIGKLPNRKGAPAVPGVAALMVDAADIFLEAGGARNHSLAFRTAVAEFVGYEGQRTSPEGFRRLVDKSKSKKGKKSGSTTAI
jgi:hypothetical protein